MTTPPSPETPALSAERNAELAQRAQELLSDIGQVLHANTTLLVMTKQTLIAAAEGLGAENAANSTLPDTEEFDEQLLALAARLENALQQLIASVPPERRLDTLHLAQWETLARDAAFLREVRERVPIAEMRVPTLRKVAHGIVQFCRANPSGKFAREPLRNVRDQAEELERRAVLFDVFKTQNAILQMDGTLRSLRDYLTSGMRETTRERFAVREIVESALQQLAEYSRNSRVEIVWKQRDLDVHLNGNPRDLTRALTNLLHNAIKYTWRRERTRAPWVKLTTTVQDRSLVIAIENWGVPIEQEELDNNLIFQMGYRGRRANDRGRLGTGIGLTDAQNVILAHGGTLTVDSHPAYATARATGVVDYTQPFVTTVTITLPLA